MFGLGITPAERLFVGKGGEDPGATLVADVTPRAPNGEGGVNVG